MFYSFFVDFYFDLFCFVFFRCKAYSLIDTRYMYYHSAFNFQTKWSWLQFSLMVQVHYSRSSTCLANVSRVLLYICHVWMQVCISTFFCFLHFFFWWKSGRKKHRLFPFKPAENSSTCFSSWECHTTT